MKIFFVRHGETDYGKKHFTIGHIDITLNETGKKEAQATAIFLKHCEERFNRFNRLN